MAKNWIIGVSESELQNYIDGRLERADVDGILEEAIDADVDGSEEEILADTFFDADEGDDLFDYITGIISDDVWTMVYSCVRGYMAKKYAKEDEVRLALRILKETKGGSVQ